MKVYYMHTVQGVFAAEKRALISLRFAAQD